MAEKVVKVLAARNEVTILCGRPSYDPSARRSWRPDQTELPATVLIIRVGPTDSPRFRMKRRMLNYHTYSALEIPRALCAPCDGVLPLPGPPFAGIIGAFVAM